MLDAGLLARVLGFIARRPSLSRILFNRVFKSRRVPRGHNAFLEQAIGNAEPGAALDVAMGEGRNAIFLASRGWIVTGFDVSDEALARATKSGAQAGVIIRAVRDTAEAFDYGVGRWDLVVLCYAWAPISNPAYTARLQQSLAKGGLVVFEHFVHDGPDTPPNAVGSPDPGTLPQLFSSLEILVYDEPVAAAEWQPFGKLGPQRLARMIARKPAD